MDVKTERRKKIIQLLKDVTLTQSTNKTPIPSVVSEFILREYGLSDASCTDYTEDEIADVVANLENALCEKCKTDDVRGQTSLTDAIVGVKDSCQAFEDAKNAFVQTATQLITLMNQIAEHRESYSDHLKQKSVYHQEEFYVISAKLKFLKLQSLMKMYMEKNAFPAHLKLRDILEDRLGRVRAQNAELAKLHGKYTELKGNSAYGDLLQTYKKLLMNEKKIDYIIDKL